MRVHRRGSIASASSLAPMVLLAPTLAGCFSDRGLAIEVDVSAICATSATCATSVELYIGAQDCDPENNVAGITCASIAPPPRGEDALAGHVSFRDAPPPEIADVKGRKATFQLRADAPTTLPIVIAVGKIGSGQAAMPVGVATLHDVVVPANGARVLTTTMAALGMPGSPGERLLLWSTPPSSCAMVEHGGTSPMPRDFVVPADDPDCDGLVANDCNPAAFEGTDPTLGARERPTCFTSSGSPACVLGARGCANGGSTDDNTCAPLASRTCIPQGFCGGSCDAYDETCMRAQLAAPVPPTRIDCQVPTMLAVDNLGLCPGRAQATIDLGALYPGQCPQPEIGALPGVAFDDHHTFGGATMKLSSPTRPCQFTITWTDGTRLKAAGMDDFGILRFRPETGPTLLLPIALHFLPPADTCLTTEFKCGPPPDAINDSLWSCAR